MVRVRVVRVCAAFCLTAAGTVAATAATAPTAVADDVLHDVTYTVSTERPFLADIYYRDTQPPNFADYSHDPYVFSPKIEADLGPDRPWVLNVKLADPQSWAMVVGTSGLSPNPPGFRCTLAVDGTVVVSNSGAKGALCSLRHW
ncbi:MAG TPA: hypothetical protein PLH92_06015 [Mycobacterium sp.]|uniref:hypothetical protein n=1 Tax=Mycolicibacterium sp. TaxID=2320850 RepID=UPI0025FB7368|nr:hypothetical protein [Mycolicibacterium sp.]HPX36878.1 hypothetical protein [Mycobacterium sp.]HQC76258.1 hypothetical protein [Mycobacterium sp.]